MQALPTLPVFENRPAEATAPLVSYAYSYPHKSSYRPLTPSAPLEQVWRNENRDRLALYVHIPFCEMRCGFCNLFTQSQPQAERVDAYLQTLARQMHVVRSEIPEARIASLAVGGGTPTFLTATQLERLLGGVQATFNFSVADVHASIETSPATATADRLRVLARYGVERISLGIQSFDRDATSALGRPQSPHDVEQALRLIRSGGFPVLNIDLIYGDPAQSRTAWIQTVRQALAHAPEELYLYPLYVRPETGLARRSDMTTGLRHDLYRAARDLLLGHGYEQLSLRCFRQAPLSMPAGEFACARDGTIGLGCGARSYTRSLHYATRFAVTQAGIRAILDDWISQPDSQLALATHGIRLSATEQQRRFVILNVLQSTGLNIQDYFDRFHASPFEAVPELADLQDREWLTITSGQLHLTESGLENSDVAGPLLFSETVRNRLREFVRR